MNAKQATKWKPPTTVSKKEFIGRRAFGSRVFDKSTNGIHYKIDVFLESGKLGGLSVDRLGVKTAQTEVMDYLRPLCDSMAKKRKTSFIGWAQIHVMDLVQKVSKIDSVGENNPYHAEIDLTSFQNKQALRAFAFELCVHAAKHSFIPR